MVFIEPFDRLLNEISHELDEQNLRSLIHICGYYIGGRDRENIKDGLGLFLILRHNGVLSKDREKVANLLEIIKEMRPKRRDLVEKVKDFIYETVEAPETILVIGPDNLESSGEEGLRLVRENGGDTPMLVPSTSRFCSMNCCCCACNCYSRRCTPFVCGFLASTFFVLAIIAAIAWYCDIPRVTEYLNSDKDRQNAGKYAVGLLGFFGFVLVAWAIVKHKQDEQECYSSFDNQDFFQENAVRRFGRKSVQRSDSSISCGSSRSLPKGASRKYYRYGSKASSFASTVSSSTLPIGTTQDPQRGARSSMNKLPDDVVPDDSGMVDERFVASLPIRSASLSSELVFPHDQEVADNLGSDKSCAGASGHILYDP